MRLNYFLMLVLAVSIFSFANVNAQMNEVDYNSTGNFQNAHFTVQVLKYEPYPVNAGEWFDLWIKVQNMGENSAPNAVFELIPQYPFESNDSLVRNYGLVLGSIDAYKIDQTYDATDVILKYRVKAADNAPDGESTIKFNAATDSSGSAASYNLPIVIGKTKTDFDAVMQDTTTAGSLSFSIANIGENEATAVTVSLEPQDGIIMGGSGSYILGNLASGDFTTVTFQATPKTNVTEVKLKIDYTDIAGIRDTLEKTIAVNLKRNIGTGAAGTTATGTNGQTFRRATSSNLLTSIFSIAGLIAAVIGIILGMLILRIFQRARKKKKE